MEALLSVVMADEGEMVVALMEEMVAWQSVVRVVMAVMVVALMEEMVAWQSVVRVETGVVEEMVLSVVMADELMVVALMEEMVAWQLGIEAVVEVQIGKKVEGLTTIHSDGIITCPRFVV
jgi:hypothetical protein